MSKSSSFSHGSTSDISRRAEDDVGGAVFVLILLLEFMLLFFLEDDFVPVVFPETDRWIFVCSCCLLCEWN